ncbi:DUF4270 domain-containing protein [Aureispira anguillae]|uniref:DUF4270 domain-containing protein n=1 Tax=Aureispira anguillae TaxID=2864201 RepID=A0A915YLJ6_9BACT|nr:DUF4270 domain-containing protein [Aureispira anguillae]BDS15166.1 DUF4270 domain-containing protein [Aureispira anguillae]
MEYNLKSLLYSMLAVGLFSAMGCSKSSELGLSLVEQEQSDILFSDTSTLILTTKEADPIGTSGRSFMVCGAYTDAEWGESIASSYMNFRLNSTGASFPNSVLDSLVLSLAYESYGHYGELRVAKPTVTNQVWEIARVVEDIEEATTYNSDHVFMTDGNLLKSNFQFNPNDTAKVTIGGTEFAPHLRIRLDDQAGIDLAKTFLDPQGTATGIYESNTKFKDWFKGIHVRPASNNPTNGSIVRFKSKDALTKLTLYYTDTSNNGSVAKTFEFLTNEDAEVVSTFQHTHPVDLTDNLATDTLVYVQGLDGLHTKVEFPNVGNLGNVIINKAELVLMVADTGNNEFSEPIQLVAKIKNSSNELVVVDDIATSIGKYGSYFVFGGVLENIGNHKFVYRMLISEQMQALVDGTTPEKAIYLTLPSALDPERIKLINHQGVNKAKLYLTYTKIQ